MKRYDLQNERDRDVEIYNDGRYSLGQKGGAPYLKVGEKVYLIGCHPYEPCTVLKSEDGAELAFIHNAFEPFSVLKSFAEGKTVSSISGKDYSPLDFCKTLEYAAEYLFDTDISYVEGALAVEKLKELGATSPEKAVLLKDIGVRMISDRFSHSKKLSERVMYTNDGKAYVRIKK